MKTSTNFSEMSDIFAAIAKAETKTQAYKNARAAYEGASAEFDGDAGNRVAADLMLKTYDEMLKARRALNASFTKLLTLFQATTSCYEDEHSGSRPSATITRTASSTRPRPRPCASSSISNIRPKPPNRCGGYKHSLIVFGKPGRARVPPGLLRDKPYNTQIP